MYNDNFLYAEIQATCSTELKNTNKKNTVTNNNDFPPSTAF